MVLQDLISLLGDEIIDPDEGTQFESSTFQVNGLTSFWTESFLLFSQAISSQNLGFVDSKATLLELTVGGRELSIQQSPTILTSNRVEGTTGAGRPICLGIKSKTCTHNVL